MKSLHMTGLEAGRVAPPQAAASETWAGSSEPVRSLPDSAYSSLVFQAEEDAAIWTRAWVCVGFAADVAAAGDILPYTVGNHGIHVERLADGSLMGRFNKAQHGGCRTVPLQCQTGTKTRCSFTACGYSRDRAPIAASDPDRLLHLDQYLGLRPERLLPVPVRTWGPLLLAQLDPTAETDFDWPDAIEILDSATVSSGPTTWIEYNSNWKHLATTLAGTGPSDILFPNVVVVRTEGVVCLVVLQPTALSKTLCRIRVLGADTQETAPDAVPAVVAERAAQAEAMQAGRLSASNPAKQQFDRTIMDAMEALHGEELSSTLYRTNDKGGW